MNLAKIFLMVLFVFMVACSDQAKTGSSDADEVVDSVDNFSRQDSISDSLDLDVSQDSKNDESSDVLTEGDSEVDASHDAINDSDETPDVVTKKCTDINCDGYPDIVFANTDKDDDTNIKSYVYLGSKDGYSVKNRIEIPTIGAMGVDYADVNKDGYIDIAFASVKENVDGKETRFTTSLLYYGTKNGFDLKNPVKFPTVGCSDITLADLDQDGWIDLIAPNRYKGDKSNIKPSDYKINSYVYWGGPSGFDTSTRLELPTVGAAKARVADLNKDGNMDIVFPNGVQEMVGVFESYIYWGNGKGKTGWPTKTTLPSVSPETATIYDINQDGYDDIFISGWLCLTKCKLKNRIYWGSKDGFDKEHFTKIDTDGITDAIFVDLNKDGNLDIVLADGSVKNILTQEFAKTSHIYWGEPSGNADKFKWSKSNKTDLPAIAASEAGVRDLNGDGYLDIVFASHYAAKEGDPEYSQIYWGSKDGYSAKNVTLLPTQHAAGMKIIGTYNPQ